MADKLNEMIVRVATAVAVELGKQDFSEKLFALGPELTLPYLDQGEVDFGRVARAAIEAMRGPTEAMKEAGMEHTGDPCWLDNVDRAFNAMIDEALK